MIWSNDTEREAAEKHLCAQFLEKAQYGCRSQLTCLPTPCDNSMNRTYFSGLL